MRNPNFKYPDTKSYETVIKTLKSRGIQINQIADIAYEMTHEFVPQNTKEHTYNVTVDVLHKRDLLNTAMIMLDLDRLAKEHHLSQPLNDIITNDAGVFGVDEDLALSISTLYGPIGATNFDYLDRVKEGIIKEIDTRHGHVTTFLDDLIGAIVAAVCGKLSHEYA